jgi:hypothetical protein
MAFLIRLADNPEQIRNLRIDRPFSAIDRFSNGLQQNIRRDYANGARHRRTVESITR